MNIFSKRLNRLPPYMFGKLKQLTHERRQQGIDIIDLGMGNPNQPTPQPIIDKLTEAAQGTSESPLLPLRAVSTICVERSVGIMNVVSALTSIRMRKRLLLSVLKRDLGTLLWL